MNPQDLGTEFAAQFDIRRPLQTGADASVFLAYQRGLDRLVALKFLRPWLVNSAAERDRFLSEARLLAQLKHQHVIEVFDVSAEPRPYMVMEYLDGWNLRQILSRRGPLPLRDVFSLMLQISSGVQAIHERGVIHGNLKPENILVDRDGWSKITDLGLASNSGKPDTSIEGGNRSGTPAYMAPELIRGGPGTRQTDVYALGCILYELLVGQTPFVAQDPAEMCRQHLEVPHPPVRGLTRTIPIELENIVRTALAKATGRRYPDVNSMRLDLEDLALFAQLWIDDYVPSANPTEPERFPAWAVTLPVRPLTPAGAFPAPLAPHPSVREVPHLPPRPLAPHLSDVPADRLDAAPSARVPPPTQPARGDVSASSRASPESPSVPVVDHRADTPDRSDRASAPPAGPVPNRAREARREPPPTRPAGLEPPPTTPDPSVRASEAAGLDSAEPPAPVANPGGSAVPPATPSILTIQGPATVPHVAPRKTGPLMLPPVYMPPVPAELVSTASPPAPDPDARPGPPPLALLAGLALLGLAGYKTYTFDPVAPPIRTLPAPAIEVLPARGGLSLSWSTRAPCTTRLWYQVPGQPQVEVASALAPDRAHHLLVPAVAGVPGVQVRVDLGGNQRSAPVPLRINGPALAIKAARVVGREALVESPQTTELSAVLLAVGSKPEEVVPVVPGLRSSHRVALPTGAAGRILRVTARTAAGEEAWTVLEIAAGGPRLVTVAQPEALLPDRFTSDGSLLIQWNVDRTWASELVSGRALWAKDFAPAFPARPLLRRDAIFVAGRDGRVRKLDRTSGETVWVTEVTRGRAIGGLATDVDQVYAVTPDGIAMAIDLARGGVRWATQVGDAISTGPVVTPPETQHGSGTLWVATKDRLIGVNVDTGAERVSAPLSGAPTRLLTAGVLILAVGAATEAFDIQGKPVWTAPIQSSHAVADDDAVALVAPGRVVVLDARTGRSRHALERVARQEGERPPPTALALSARAVYAALGDGAVVAVDRATGQEHWTLPVDHGVRELARIRGDLLLLDGESHLSLVTEP